MIRNHALITGLFILFGAVTTFAQDFQAEKDRCQGKVSVTPAAQIDACDVLVSRARVDKTTNPYTTISERELSLALNNRGHAHAKQNELDKALSDYNEAIAIEQNSEEKWLKYEKSYSWTPFPLPYVNRCWAWNKKNEPDRAIADCDKAIELGETGADVYAIKGSIYELKGEPARAKENFRTALATPGSGAGSDWGHETARRALSVQNASQQGRGAEIAACNFDEVKATLIKGTFDKMKASLVEVLTSANSNVDPAKLRAGLQNWTATVVNIRQLSYDDSNDIRFCAAEFEYQNSPPPEALFNISVLVGLYGTDLSCAKGVKYKIEPLLDKPGGFYVSWQCLPATSSPSVLGSQQPSNQKPNAPSPSVPSKTDILGFKLGMTIDELRAKVDRDKLNCGILKNPDDWGHTTICFPNPTNRNENFRFAFTQHMEPKVVRRLQYQFQSRSLDGDLINSVAQQFKPQSVSSGMREITFNLGGGLQLELVKTGRPNDPPGNWEMSLTDPKWQQLDGQAGINKHRLENPPTKRF